MKRSFCSIFLTLALTLTVSFGSVRVSASSAQKGVTASAVIAPARISRMGFIISGLVKEVAVREGDTVQAGQILVVLNTPELEYSVAAAQASLRFAQANLEVQRHRRVKDRRNGRVYFDVVPPEVRQRADAQVQQAQAALEIAQATLKQNTLTASYDGTVTSVNIVPGEFVQQNQVVLTLAALNDLQIETTDLSERDITNVSMGAPVNIAIEALNETVSGKVIGISPIADTVGGDVVFKVTIAFDQQPANLLWGMTAEVTIGGE